MYCCRCCHSLKAVERERERAAAAAASAAEVGCTEGEAVEMKEVLVGERVSLVGQ